ncbi:hypothetical protein H310_13895 [Aphanomyces invadans]|uniref:Uncharacterized protein n=1 Tax=Aphanomyces invadans TaxID=157072 RepID=A0A024TCB5_9STRA|nr:hypothetical protein H310_13895 [Aphanomyces invadans]ETV91649.1 hypothetical protein H310_13895 [Aphanomyces invadans]|eukprot:XP_008879768.1 hypothetical protein H310_13895 [Aphanomyces invadans]
MHALLHAALVKLLVHSIRQGHVEGIRLAIEKAVDVRYVDKKGRNLLQLAIKQDTATRMQMYVILADAGCDINHTDLRGWSCVHYACATGASDVLMDLLRRDADVAHNRFGYCGEIDLLFPRILHAQSLLQHTEQLTHNDQVHQCWSIFHRHIRAAGYNLHTHTGALVHPFKSPLKVLFVAPVDHSALDRIRVVDLHADLAIWLQLSKTFLVPPGSVGSITLDAEILHRPSVYRIYYEQHVATPLPLPPHALRALEHTLCVKDLDSGRTVSVQAANDVVLSALKSMRSTHADVVLSPESAAQELCVPLGGNAAHPDDGVEWSGVHDVDSNIESSASASSVEFPGPDACEQGMLGGICGADDAVSGSYRCVAMLTISVVMRNPRQTKPRVEAELSLQSTSHYNITVSYTGHIGLTLEGLPMDATTHKFRLVVVDVTDAFAQLYPQVQVGDRLVALNDNNTEYAGLKHTVWELKDARRPLVLQFQRSSPHDKVARRTGLVARLRHGPAPVLAA